MVQPNNLHPKHVVQCASGDALTMVQPNNLHPKHVVQCASGDALTPWHTLMFIEQRIIQ